MLSVHGLFRVLFREMWIWNWNEYWTPFCCCFAQLMDADTGNVTVEPWRSRPSGLQNSYRSIRGELKLQASLDHKQMFPSPPRILLQRRLEVWVRNLSCCYRSSLWCWWKPQVASSKSSEIWFFVHIYIWDGQSSPKSSCTEQAARRNSVRAPAGSSLKRLRSSCMVIRMDDVDIRQARFNHHLTQFYC